MARCDADGYFPDGLLEAHIEVLGGVSRPQRSGNDTDGAALIVRGDLLDRLPLARRLTQRIAHRGPHVRPDYLQQSLGVFSRGMGQIGLRITMKVDDALVGIDHDSRW